MVVPFLEMFVLHGKNILEEKVPELFDKDNLNNRVKRRSINDIKGSSIEESDN